MLDKLMKNKQYTTYLGLVIAFLAVIAEALGWLDPVLAWGIAGLFGFGSMMALRTFIESKGWKTYIAAGVPTLLGILLLLGLIDVTTYKALITAFAPLTGITVTQALSKEKKLKQVA